MTKMDGKFTLQVISLHAARLPSWWPDVKAKETLSHLDVRRHQARLQPQRSRQPDGWARWPSGPSGSRWRCWSLPVLRVNAALLALAAPRVLPVPPAPTAA